MHEYAQELHKLPHRELGPRKKYYILYERSEKKKQIADTYIIIIIKTLNWTIHYFPASETLYFHRVLLLLF